MAVRKDRSDDKNRKEAQNFKLIRPELERGGFTPLYILYGNQAYLRNQYRDVIRNYILGDASADNMNLSVFRGDSFEMREVIDLAQTLPFFSEHRVIILENTGLLRPAKSGKKKAQDDQQAEEGQEEEPKEEQAEEEQDDLQEKGGSSPAAVLAQFLPDMPETTHLIIVEEQIDMRSGLCRYAEKNGRFVCCDTPERGDMIKWIRGRFQKDYGLLISQPVIISLLDRTGDDMHHITSEIEKVSAYCLGRSEVTEKDLDAVCTVVLRDRIFELIDAIIGRRGKQALSVYMEMLAQQTSAAQILALTIRQLNQLLQVRDLLEQNNNNESTVAESLHIHPYIVKKIRRSLHEYARGAPEEALKECLKTDTAYKSGKMDAGIAMEMLIVRMTN